MKQHKMNELISDPKRQASDTLDAYIYQIWQSLSCWISLGANEALFLEGAEDIDHHKPDGVKTIQVRRASKPRSLGSKDILEAIAHYWGHQKANRKITITYRFLTTAERGFEKWKPFRDVKGMDLWDQCKNPGTPTRQLRDYLSARQTLPSDLRDFIKDASDDQLREQLLNRIEWDTGNEPTTSLIKSVKREVEGYGNRALSLPHSESIKAIPQLLQHVLEIARQKGNRKLFGKDFRELFEEITNPRVSRDELHVFREFQRKLGQLGMQVIETALGGESIVDSIKFVRQNRDILKSLKLPNNGRLVERKLLAAALLDKLNATGLLVLRGTTGMGKSTLANSVATANLGNWHRLELRGLEPEQIKSKLLYAAVLLEDGREQVDCLIDDLNFDQQIDVYENALVRFIDAIKLNHGRLIVTTQGALPSRIISSYDVTAASFFDVPLLSPAEVAELASNHGCPTGSSLDKWSSIIYAQTQGHPQLAHAYVRSQESKGWPQPTVNDLLTFPGIDQIRGEVGQRLRDQLSVKKARKLLYRLAIFTGRFKRRQALHLGRLKPKVKQPGDVFDSLIGPWIEQIDGQHFRLSPLLTNTARENFSEQKLLELNRAAAESFLDLESVDISGFAALLTHGLAGRDRGTLASTVLSIFSSEDVLFPELSRHVVWFGFACLGPGERLFEGDSFLNDLLRRLQFKIAVETSPKLAIKVAQVWEQEVRQIKQTELPAGVSQLLLLTTFLNEMTSANQVPFSIRTYVSYLCENYHLIKRFKEYWPESDDEQETLPDKYGLTNNPQLFLFLATRRCKSGADVVELLATLDALASEEAAELWQLLSHDDFQAMLLIDKGWLRESEADLPDWQKYLESLEQSLVFASKQRAVSLMVAVYRARAIVLKEYCNDREGALQALDEGERAVGQPHLFLREYRAKLLFLEEHYDEALSIWQNVLRTLEHERNEGRIYAYRDAAICATKLGDWSEAADLFRRGAEAAKLPSAKMPDGSEFQQDHTLENSFRTEYAFALWKAGERADAIIEFARIAGTFAPPHLLQENHKAHLLYRRVGHAIGWIGSEIYEGQNPIEPLPGWFTEQHVNDEIVRQLPQSPVLLLTIWYILARLEYSFTLGNVMFRRFTEELHKSPQPAATLSYYDLRLRHSLKELNTEKTVSDFLKLSAECKKQAAQNQAETSVWSEVGELKRVLFVGLTRLLSERQRQEVPLAQWRLGVERVAGLKEEVGKWLDFVAESLEAKSDKLSTLLKDGSADNELRWVAALLITAIDEVDPETRFYANIVLVYSDYAKQWQDLYDDSLATLVSREWEKIAAQEPFSLSSPRTNCPAILSACKDDSVTGLKKAARILLAAKNAVQTRMGEVIENKLRQLAE